MIRYASCVWELPMPTTFRAYQPDQPLLLPPDLQEWVPPGHLAHHVSDVVDALDLTAFYGLCCKPDVGVSQIRTTTVLSSCFCVGQTVL